MPVVQHARRDPREPRQRATAEVAPELVEVDDPRAAERARPDALVVDERVVVRVVRPRPGAGPAVRGQILEVRLPREARGVELADEAVRLGVAPVAVASDLEGRATDQRDVVRQRRVADRVIARRERVAPREAVQVRRLRAPDHLVVAPVLEHEHSDARGAVEGRRRRARRPRHDQEGGKSGGEEGADGHSCPRCP